MVVEAVNEMRIEKNGIKIKNGGHISSCCNGNRETAYGYQWRYEFNETISPAKNTHKQGCSIIQLDRNGEIIKIHENCVKASEQFGDKKDKAYFSIARCCQGRSKTAYGYKWEYLD